ncbi:MAG: hypothetical protein RLZZ156_21 [Deinococcota bacterium]|jgi:uncharacterized delta-60 repeat protein
MKRFLSSAIGLAALLAACQTPMPNLEQKPIGVAGQVELTFDLRSKTAFARYKKSGLITQTVQTSISFGAAPTIGFLADGSNNYVSATFDVNNLTGSSLTDLTLVAKHQQGNHVGTAVKNVVNFSGNALDFNVFAQNVKPTLIPTVLTPFTVNSNVADLQFLTELEMAALQSQAVSAGQVITANGEYLLPYGFMARSSNTSRTLATGNSVGSLTVSIKLPSGNEPSSNVTRFSMTFVAFDQAVIPRVSEALEEQSNSSAATRATSFGVARVAALRNSALLTESDGTKVNVCQVRTAGTVVAPTARIDTTALLIGSGLNDPCFAASGRRVFGGSSSDKVVARHIVPDGGFLLAGEFAQTPTNTDAMVLKYKPDGSLDSSFGVGGLATMDAVNDDLITGFHLLPNGKMYLVGSRFRIYKFNANGTPDTTFGTNGFASTVLSQSSTDDFVITSAVNPSDDSIVLAGVVVQAAGNASDIGLAVFTNTGILNNSYNGSGKLFWEYLSVASNPDTPIAVYFNADGSLLVFGDTISSNRDWVVFKLDNNGQLDAINFGNGGYLLIDVLGAADFLTVVDRLSDGNFLLAGTVSDPTIASTNRLAVVKVTDAGQLDTSFANQGQFVQSATGSTYREAVALHVLADNRVLVAGTDVSLTRGVQFGLLKLSEFGALVSSFGTSGVATPVNFFAGSGNDTPTGITVLSDGSIVLGGIGTKPGAFPAPTQPHMALAKYTSSGVLDTTFNSTGLKTTLFGNNGSNQTALPPAVFTNDALLHVGWAGFTGQSNNITLYKTLP